jgi:hypothetical protein
MSEVILKSAVDIANKWGIFAAMVIFFIWQSNVRETAMRSEMEKDRMFVRDTLVEALRQNTSALNQCTTVLTRVATGGAQ